MDAEKRMLSTPVAMGRWAAAVALAALLAVPVSAQTDMGVTMDSWHLNVSDVGAAKDMFVAMGGQASMMGGMGEVEAVELPGVTVYLRESSGPPGGTLGSVVEHVGLHVPNVDEAIARWQAAGVPVEHSGARFPQAWVTTSDGLRIELLQNPEMEGQVRHHHVHFYVPEADILTAQQWYADVFGAEKTMRGNFQSTDIPGANLTYSAADGYRAPTRGRVLDKVGFTVPNLESFCRKLEGRSDVALDRPCERDMRGQLSAGLVDPWGAYIHLTEAR